MDVLGRDDELSSLHAFLDRPGDGGMAGSSSRARRGSGSRRSGSPVSRLRACAGFHVLSSRPAEVELGVAYAGLGDLLEDALGEVGDELEAPRRRALETALLLREDAGAPVDFRTLAVAVRSALHVLAERRPILLAIDDVQWLDAPSRTALEFALRRLQGENIRLLLARRLGSGTEVSELELALDERPDRAQARRPAQSGRAARDPAAAARPGVRAADAAAPPRSRGRKPLLRARARPRHRRQTSTRRSRCPSRRRWRRSSGLASTGCRTRRAERCCSPARTAG